MNEKKLIFQEMDEHLLCDEKPSVYFDGIKDQPFFSQEPYLVLGKLKETEQSPKHHPEGNVWNHTMLVIDEAARVKHKSSHPKEFMWAALLHDQIGRAHV